MQGVLQGAEQTLEAVICAPPGQLNRAAGDTGVQPPSSPPSRACKPPCPGVKAALRAPRQGQDTGRAKPEALRCPAGALSPKNLQLPRAGAPGTASWHQTPVGPPRAAAGAQPYLELQLGSQEVVLGRRFVPGSAGLRGEKSGVGASLGTPRFGCTSLGQGTGKERAPQPPAHLGGRLLEGRRLQDFGRPVAVVALLLLGQLLLHQVNVTAGEREGLSQPPAAGIWDAWVG